MKGLDSLRSLGTVTRWVGKQGDWWLPLLLVLAVVAIYGRYRNTDHFTASGDFPPAVSYALNFQKAVEAGQWLPRWVVIPRDFTAGGGSLDGTPQTADAPDFQYYGFLQSAAAYPFLRWGVPPIKAVEWTVIVVFSLGGLVLYRAGRVLGARPLVAFLGSYGYVISPWLVSNFYGRGGISESFGQALLPLLVLGFAHLVRGRYRRAVLAIASGVALLALSHNIFLLYGVFLCVLLAAFLALSTLVRGTLPGVAISGRDVLGLPLIIGAGVAIGMALSAWQWMPVMDTIEQTSFQYFGTFGDAGKVPVPLVDWTGVLGWPRRFIEPWSGATREFFFTLGWWTIPSVLALFFCRRESRRFAGALFGCFALFLVLAYWPSWVYPSLPGCFGATQFTFRLLAFLSVLGSCALFVALPRLPGAVVLALLVPITLSQLHVIRHPMPPQKMTDEQYLKGYEYNAFYANSRHEKDLRYWYDGMLSSDNILYLYRGKDLLPVFVRIKGKTAPGLEQTRLYLGRVANPFQPVSNVVEVEKGTFDITLTATGLTEPLRLYASNPTNQGGRWLSIRPEEVHLVWGEERSLVLASEVSRVKAHGYERVFALDAAERAGHVPDPEGFFIVELPMIFNRFVVASQDGSPLHTTADCNHRLCARVSDLSHPLTVKYVLPAKVWYLTGSGLVAVLGLVAWEIVGRRRRRINQGPQAVSRIEPQPLRLAA